MDAKTVLLTANTETVYAISHLDLRNDGPTVVEAPPRCSVSSVTASSVTWPTLARSGQTRAQAENCSILPPGYTGSVPEGYFVSRSPTYSAMFAVRGFQVDNKTDQAVGSCEADQGLSTSAGVERTPDAVHEWLEPEHGHALPG